MEAIKRFEFELDLSNCEKVYDYVNQREHVRPETGWHMDDICHSARLSNYQNADRKHKKMLRRLEESHREAGLLETDPNKGALEKESKKGGSEEKDDGEERMEALFGKGTFPGEDGKQSLPLWVLPVYRPGDVVRGKLHLELTEELPAKQLRVEFIGRAGTLLHYQTHNSAYQDKGWEAYAESSDIYWTKQGEVAPEKPGLGALPSSETIPPGRHSFLYEHVIPRDVPCSIPPLIPQHWTDYARLSYLLKATIDKDSLFRSGNIILFRGIWVEELVDIARNPENVTPFTTEETIQPGFFGSSGTIKCKTTLRGKGAVKSEPLSVKVEVENLSSEEIDGIAARLDMKGTYRAKHGRWHGSRNFTVNGPEIKTGPVKAGEVRVHNLELAIDFMEDYVDPYLAPVGNLSRCSLINLGYILHVEVKRGLLKRNLKLDIPINLGTHNSKGWH